MKTFSSTSFIYGFGTMIDVETTIVEGGGTCGSSWPKIFVNVKMSPSQVAVVEGSMDEYVLTGDSEYPVEGSFREFTLIAIGSSEVNQLPVALQQITDAVSNALKRNEDVIRFLSK